MTESGPKKKSVVLEAAMALSEGASRRLLKYKAASDKGAVFESMGHLAIAMGASLLADIANKIAGVPSKPSSPK